MTDEEFISKLEGNDVKDTIVSLANGMDFEQLSLATVTMAFMSMYGKKNESGEPHSNKCKKAAEFIRAFESYPNEAADLFLWYVDKLNALTDCADVDDKTKDEFKLSWDDGERDQFRVEFQETLDEILSE